MSKTVIDQYFYRCYSCGHEYSLGEIETEPAYLCPDCGNAEDNQPLTGVLSIIYDMDSLRNRLSREQFLTLTPGRPWLYPDLWPLDYQSNNFDQLRLERLSLPSNLLFSVDNENDCVYILDDTRNPTYSYKDRASILVALKAIQSGYSELSVASTGNAGSSLAGICARLNLDAHVWVPDKIPHQKLMQIVGYGAEVHMVQGSYDMAFDLSREISQNQNWYNRNTAYNPLTIEGKKSAAYDIFISTNGEIPDLIVVPVGDGAILGGVYKGFMELLQLGWIDHLPKLIGVQADGSDALVRYMATDKFEFRGAKTIADSICAGAPRNLYMAADAIRESDGEAITVSDAQILNAQKECAIRWGFLIEPSAAATFAAYVKLKQRENIKPNEKTLLLFTGSGLKDIKSIENWTDQPGAKSVTQWKEIFATSNHESR
jgi:threonine synthase